MLCKKFAKTYSFILSCLQLISAVTVSICLTASLVKAEGLAGDGSPGSLPQQHIEIGLDSSFKNPSIKIDFESREFTTANQSREAINLLADEKAGVNNSTVLVSFDDEELFNSTLKPDRFPKNNLYAVPVSIIKSDLDAQKEKSNFLQLVKTFTAKTIESVKKDRIGLMVVTFTTVSESLIWIHSGNLSNFEKTSNVIFTVGLGIVFGLNKDTWSKTTRPLQAFFRNLIKPGTSDPTELKEVASRFLGNFALASVLTVARIPMISMDQIVAEGLHLHFFTMPLLSAFIYTAAVFTWNEQIAMIDEGTHPVSKFALRRLNEARSLFLGTFATTAALLNPGQHGLTPWIAVSGVGIMGGFLYYNSENVLKWIENHVLLEPLSTFLQKKNGKGPLLQCDNLFSLTAS